MLRFALIIGGLTLTACAPPPLNACQKAGNYGQMFGTPENKGPCWGRTASVSQMGNIRSYIIEMPLPGYVVAHLTYQGDKLVQAGISQ